MFIHCQDNFLLALNATMVAVDYLSLLFAAHVNWLVIFVGCLLR